MSFYRQTGKRVLDLAITLAALPVALPLAALVAAAVFLDLGAPVLFRHRRIGKDGTPFVLLKFRTMRDGVDAAGASLPDAERLTRCGALIRRTSLDELPELVHVLTGTMSLVGPRPLLPEYVPYYSTEQARRHEVRPGLTGLAQIRGRNTLAWDDRLALDVEYVDRMSLALDLAILCRTVLPVLAGRGISAEGHATMPRFDQDRGRQGNEGRRDKEQAGV